MEKKTLFNSLPESSKILIKLIIILVIILVLFIPVNMIESIVHEREQLREKAVEEIVNIWGPEQKIGGPVLVVPFEGKHEKYNAYFLPELLNIEGIIKPEIRFRGIYEVVVYKTELFLSGKFSAEEFDVETDGIFLWEDAYLIVELPELSSITERILLDWNDKNFSFGPADENLGLLGEAISAGIDMQKPEEDISFSFILELNGSGSLSFFPFGNETNVIIKSDWDSPGFTGSVLPSDRNVSEKGFDAEWNVYSISRNYPQLFYQNDKSLSSINDSSFGINLILPADTYLKSMRSLKYSILFLILPFLCFFIFEIFSKIKIHPFQYFLIGLSNCIFYLLLISISEHTLFNYAYLIAGISIVGLSTFYSRYLLKSFLKALIIGFILFSLYLFLYVVLQSEDYALLIGSVGMFIILAAVMIITRNIDWYKLDKRNR